MKKILFLLGIFFIPVSILAQDIIYKTDGTEIKAKVIEIKTDKIDYLNFEVSNDTLRNIPISDVFMIIYEGGDREVFKAKEPIEDVAIAENNLTNSKSSNGNLELKIVDARANKIIVGKAPSNLARGAGLIVQPSKEISDNEGIIFNYAVMTLEKILETNGFIRNANSSDLLEININEIYHKAEVGLYGAGGNITQNCSCSVIIKKNNEILYNKDFNSTYSDKTSDFSNQEDLLYMKYYSINDKKELKSKKKMDIRDHSSKGHFISYIVVFDDIINQLINDKEFQKVSKIHM